MKNIDKKPNYMTVPAAIVCSKHLIIGLNSLVLNENITYTINQKSIKKFAMQQHK